jgi:predicted transcriptional regulator
MSARRRSVGIRSGTERSKVLRKALRRVARGDRLVHEPGLYCESVEEFRCILTEKRRELFLAIARTAAVGSSAGRKAARSTKPGSRW